jgi:hypothetical protein
MPRRNASQPGAALGRGDLHTQDLPVPVRVNTGSGQHMDVMVRPPSRTF